MSNKSWKFTGQKRITGHLTTTSNLHVGSGETDVHPELETDDKEKVRINSVVKDINDKPFIPGSTLKGNLLLWLQDRIKTDSELLMQKLFGVDSETETTSDSENGLGGKAEFLDVSLSRPQGKKSPLPYWDHEKQVFIETSVAIDRVTRTAIDQKLIHKEMVPLGVKFLVTICGPIDENETALLLAALDGFNESANPVTLGSGTASGYGKMSWELKNVEEFGPKQAQKWFSAKPRPMLVDAMEAVNKEEQARLLAEGKSCLQTNQPTVDLEISLLFEGPFLVDDPPTKSEKEKKKTATKETDPASLSPDHKVLRDADGKPRFPEKSIRGGLRSQAERIARTLGINCCNTNTSCNPVHTIKDVQDNLCPVCKLFGAPGWKSPLTLTDFKHAAGNPNPARQDFVAIDRFTGGAKPTAKFDSDYVYSPTFQGHLKLDNRRLEKTNYMAEAKGLLALVLRDLCEGDITFGFGRAKGYGSCRAEIPDNETLLPKDNIKLFLDKEGITPNIEAETETPADKSVTGTSGSTSPAGAYQKHTFHNPYHFVPVNNPDVSKWLSKDKLKHSEEPCLHTHDRYFDKKDDKKVYNGRLLCRLETKTPMFIGGKRVPGDKTEPQEIDPFMLDGKCAIPATSLRGMLSSIVEAASSSSLRVLDDKVLSRRMDMKEDSLSAMGMLLQTKNGLKLLPLALPTMSCDQNGQLQQSVPEEWREIFNVPCLKVYLDGYTTINNEVRYRGGTFLDSKPKSFSKNNVEFWYMKLGYNNWIENNGQCRLNADQPRIKTIRTRRGELHYLLGQKCVGSETPITQQKFDNLDIKVQKQYTKGVIRVLGIDDRQSDMPGTKKHEVFLPLRSGCMKNKQLNVTDALRTFHKLADERAQAEEKSKKDYPFEVKGKERKKVDGVSTLRLGNQDIVFFDIDSQGKVTEISVSSIWRKEIKGTIFDYFSNLGDDAGELLPFNPRRRYISPAELLFGFVEDRKKEKNKDREDNTDQDAALSFAGKVRVSFGRLAAGQNENIFQTPAVTLKALSTPKLPSPALYFKNRTAGYISKGTLSTQDDPQGRKFYLHCYMRDGQIVKLDKNGYPVDHDNGHALNPWESKSNLLSDQTQDARANLKVKVTPVKKGTSFYFHIDFDNLSQEELNLLCYSLRPDEHFQHKLGMGKPIGLGSVSIEPVGLYLFNRRERYHDYTDNERYNGGCWQGSDVSTDDYPSIYRDERIIPDQGTIAPAPSVLAADHARIMNKDAKQALSLLGNPNKVTAPVHYPQVRDADIEEENFKWFVANDVGTNNGKPKRNPARRENKKRKDNLKILNSNNLPELKRHEWLGK